MNENSTQKPTNERAWTDGGQPSDEPGQQHENPPQQDDQPQQGSPQQPPQNQPPQQPSQQGSPQQPPQNQPPQQGSPQQPPQQGSPQQPPQGQPPQNQPPQQGSPQQPPQGQPPAGGAPPGGSGQQGGADDDDGLGRREFMIGGAGAAALAGGGYWFFFRGPSGAAGAVADYISAVEDFDQDAAEDAVHEDGPLYSEVEHMEEPDDDVDYSLSISIESIEEYGNTDDSDEIEREVGDEVDVDELSYVSSVTESDGEAEDESFVETTVSEWVVVNDGDWKVWSEEEVDYFVEEGPDS